LPGLQVHLGREYRPIGVIPIHLFDDDVHIRIGRDQRMKLAVGRNGVACLGPQVGETNASS
jgi:hypothetical protein